MAIPLQFDGLGEDLLGSLKAARDGVAQLRDEVEKENAAVRKLGQDGVNAVDSFQESIAATTKTLTDLNKQAASGSVGKLAQDMGKATGEAEGFSGAMELTAEDIAKATFAADGLKKQQTQIRAEALKVVDAVAKKKVSEEEGLKIVTRLSKEYASNATQLRQVEEAARKIKASLDGVDQPTKSLRTQLKEAREELDRLVEGSNGKITPELIAAAQKAGELQDRFGDLNDFINAFNPDTKFRAIVGILGNVASGVQAVTAGMGLFGAESDNVNKALLKIQQTTAFIQGLQGFVGGLADNWRNLRAVIVASTAATNANTVAKTANTTATTASATASTVATGATTGFTVAVRGLTAALAANPLIAVALAIAAIAAAAVSAASDTTDYKKAVDDLIDSLDELRDKRFEELDNRLRLQTILAERKALEDGDTEAAQRRQREEDFLNKRANLVAKQLEEELDIRTLIVELESLRGKDTDSANEARTAAIAKLKEYTAELNRTSFELKALEEENTNKVVEEGNKRQEERKKQLDVLAKLEEELSRRVFAANVQESGAQERLRLQRDAANQELAILEKKLKDANAALGRGNELTVDQEIQLADIRLAIQSDYDRKSRELGQKNADARIALIVDAGERERAEFDAQLRERVAQLVEAGATEEEVLRFQQERRDTFRRQQVDKAIDLDEQLALAEVDAIRRGSESVEEFERQKELRRLAVRRQFAQQRLTQIATDTSEEAALLRAELQAILAGIDNAQRELEEKAPKLDLFALLGLELDPDQKAQFLSDLKTIGQSIQQLAALNIEAQQAQVDAQIEATEQIIADQQERREELQAELDRALDDQRAGFANNADAIREQIALVDAAEREATDEKKRLIEENKRLAAQQVRIDAVAQASALITANARLLEKGALAGIPGVIAAIAFGASLVALFSSIRARIKAATAETPQLRHGGELEGPSHERGGIALIDRRTGQHFAEAEGGEFVVNKRSTNKYRDLISSLNENDMAKAQRYAMRDLLQDTGIHLEPERITTLVREKERLIHVKETAPVEGMASLEKQMKGLREDLSGFKEQERQRPQHHEDGAVSVKPNRIDKKR